RGKYFFWASASDLYGPRFIESCIEPLDADPRVVLVGVRPMVFENDITQATPRGTVLAAQFTDQRAHMLDVMSTMVRDAHLFRGIYRRSALAQMMPLPPRFGQDQVTLVRLATLGRLIQLNGPHYFERWAPGASTHTIPMTRRIRHYEPQAGWSCYLFHRIRNVADFWRVGMAQANGAIDSGRLAVRLAGVTAPLGYQALRDDLVDLLVIALDFARIPIPRRRKSLAH
ncbi:MAG TPA: hypothetical protein VM491_19090, partial [Burkholderiaceae bacterium]|nr:hypothetical protein [Burkholderiaceae bacterium]